MIVVKSLKKDYTDEGETSPRRSRGVTFTINKGDFVSIMGPSGSGKSTLAADFEFS